jgi:hypothetical protein
VKNCAFSWFSFLKLILVHRDEQYEARALFVSLTNLFFKRFRRMHFRCNVNQTASDVTIYSGSLTFRLLIEAQKET